MAADGQRVRALLPPGSFRFIGSIICSVIALVSTCASAILVFGQGLSSDFLAKLIVLMLFVGVFLVFHPNFRITRGAKWPLVYMSVLLLSCISLLLIVLAWSYLHDTGNVGVGVFVGLIAGVIGLWGYRSRALEKLRAHFDQIWKEECRRREILRNSR